MSSAPHIAEPCPEQIAFDADREHARVFARVQGQLTGALADVRILCDALDEEKARVTVLQRELAAVRSPHRETA